MRSVHTRVEFVLAVATLAGALLAGCGPRRPAIREPGPTSLLSSPVGPALDRLWKASGGLPAWTNVESLRLKVEIEWGTGEPQGPFDVKFRPGNWFSLDVAGPDEIGGWRQLKPEADGLVGTSLERALWSLRFFGCFPFVLAEPRWEFRRHFVAGRPTDSKGGFWVAPRVEPPPDHAGFDLPFNLDSARVETSPVKACYVEPDATTGRARTLLYQPSWDKLVFWVVLKGEIEADGLRLPREIVHYSADALSGPLYPWEETAATPASGDTTRRAVILRQRILAAEVRRRNGSSPSRQPSASDAKESKR